MVAEDIKGVSNSRKWSRSYLWRGISGKICRQGIGEWRPVGATAGRNPIDNGPCTTSVTDSHRIATIGLAKRNLTNHNGYSPHDTKYWSIWESRDRRRSTTIRLSSTRDESLELWALHQHHTFPDSDPRILLFVQRQLSRCLNSEHTITVCRKGNVWFKSGKAGLSKGIYPFCSDVQLLIKQMPISRSDHLLFYQTYSTI